MNPIFSTVLVSLIFCVEYTHQLWLDMVRAKVIYWWHAYWGYSMLCLSDRLSYFMLVRLYSCSSPPINPIGRVSIPRLCIIGLVQVIDFFSRGSSVHCDLESWFKSTASSTWFKSITTLTSVQVLLHIYRWLVPGITLTVQVLHPQYSILLRSITPVRSRWASGIWIGSFRVLKICGNLWNFVGSSCFILNSSLYMSSL